MDVDDQLVQAIAMSLGQSITTPAENVRILLINQLFVYRSFLCHICCSIYL